MKEEQNKQETRNERKRNVSSSFIPPPPLHTHALPPLGRILPCVCCVQTPSRHNGLTTNFILLSPRPTIKNRMFFLPPVLRLITFCMRFGGWVPGFVSVSFSLSLQTYSIPNGPKRTCVLHFGQVGTTQRRPHNAISRNA